MSSLEEGILNIYFFKKGEEEEEGKKSNTSNPVSSVGHFSHTVSNRGVTGDVHIPGIVKGIVHLIKLSTYLNLPIVPKHVCLAPFSSLFNSLSLTYFHDLGSSL